MGFFYKFLSALWHVYIYQNNFYLLCGMYIFTKTISICFVACIYLLSALWHVYIYQNNFTVNEV